MTLVNRTKPAIIKYILIAATAFLIVKYFSELTAWMGHILVILMPLITGGMIAFVLNLPMKYLETKLFGKSQNPLMLKLKRPVCIFLSILIISFVFFLVSYLVVPQLINVVSAVIEVLPQTVENFRQWISNYDRYFPQLNQYVDQLEIDWQQVASNILAYFNDFSSNLITGTLLTIGGVIKFIIDFILSLMVALFILMSKETLQRQFTLLSDTYLSRKKHNQVMYVARVFNDSFQHFLVGEVISAIILGLLVSIGMWVLGFPYPAMIGVLTGVTSLIPYIGAYIAGGIGFILIFAQSSIQAYAFLVFMILVQQIEGNFIYPRIVGNTIGLPGLWVIVAITIGGGLMGVTGMLLAVPICSALFKILKADVHYRRSEKEDSPAEEMARVENNDPLPIESK